MSLQLGAMPAKRNVPVGLDEPAAPARGGWGRGEPREQPSNFGIACRDVLDEVRARMARQGFHWE